MNTPRELAGPVRRVGVQFVKEEKTFQELERKRFYEQASFCKPGLDNSLLSGSFVLVHALVLTSSGCLL